MPKCMFSCKSPLNSLYKEKIIDLFFNSFIPIVCDEGRQGNGSICELCPLGTLKPNIGGMANDSSSDRCMTCDQLRGPGYTTLGSGHISIDNCSMYIRQYVPCMQMQEGIV